MKRWRIQIVRRDGRQGHATWIEFDDMTEARERYELVTDGIVRLDGAWYELVEVDETGKEQVITRLDTSSR